MNKSLFICLLFVPILLNAQREGNILGKVVDANTLEELVGVSILIESTDKGTNTTLDGTYKITLPVGTYNVRASYIGYASQTKFNIVVAAGNDQIVNFELKESSQELGEVVVRFDKGRSAVAVDMVTPLSVQVLTTEEIRSNPGGNFDVSRVIQALPGVAGGGQANRNDIIIRGGAPNENVYYLDGIEIPVLNHFQTQGASGGAQGILNVSFIEDVRLSSSAFDARYDNALASTFVIKQRNGNPERLSGNIRLSGTEVATTFEGPMGPKTTFLASARRSYLQFLFQLLDLPIRPDYWDFQFKVNHKLDDKTSITLLGVGAIDRFRLAIPRNATLENEYILRSNPAIDQWTYTTGLAIRRKVDNGFMNFTLSRNMFDNGLDQFEDNDVGNEERRTLRIRSQEIENKFRWDMNQFVNGWKYSYGVMLQYVKTQTDLFSILTNELRDPQGNVIVPSTLLDYESAIDFFKYGAFGQISRYLLEDRLLISAGLRTDMNSFTSNGNQPLRTLSPRISFSYKLTDQWDFNASLGSYYKIPIYTSLSFRDAQGQLANRDMEYLRSDHYVLGLQYLPKESLRFTLEGFYKAYSQVPISVRRGISLANEGGTFLTVGNEDVVSTGEGRTYGFEFFAQQKLVKNTFVVFSYTFFRSQFAGLDEQLIPSSWDFRHLVSGILGRKFKKGWELGLKYRYAGGVPFTPFDLEASRLNYQILGVGVLDDSQLNSLRLQPFNQFDLRVDKRINFARSSLNLYFDVQNALVVANENPPNYTFARTEDNSGFKTTDGQALKPDGSNALPIILENASAIAIPTLGFIFEF
jgi:outer membrane cobalamin receptor